MAKIQDLACMKSVLKKKIVLKTKINLHSVNQKTSKEKKERKEMKWTKVSVQLKKKIILRNLRLNLRRDTTALVLVEDTEVTNKEKGKM